MQIDKDIPIPPKHCRAQGVTATMKRMAPGDSFLVETPSDAHSTHAISKKIGIKITTRKVDGGWRVWRIE